MYGFLIVNPLYSIERGFFPHSFFGQRGDLAVALCPTAAVAHHYLFLLREVLEARRDVTASSWNPRSPLPPSLLLPLLPVPRMGFHWRPSGPHPRSPNCHVGWGPGDGRPFGTEKTCVRVEGCPGMRWQSISQVSPYVKIGMLNRNRPRTIAKSGPYPVTFIQLLSCFPWAKFPPKVSNALWLCSLRTGALGIVVERWDRAPCRERSRQEWKLEICFRCLRREFICLKRDF